VNRFQRSKAIRLLMAIQSEVAQTIATKLAAALSPEEK
jgi:hypothetical protein